MHLKISARSSTALILFIIFIMHYNFPKGPAQGVLPKLLFELKGSPVRVLCWVMTRGNHEKKAVHIKNTWGKKCDKLLFMSSVGDPKLPSINLNVREGRDFLWGKTKAAFKYVYYNHLNEADWFMKADDDTFVVVENLKLMLSEYDPNSAVHFGGMHRTPRKQVYFSGGAGYILSKEALKRFVERALPYRKKCRWDEGGYSEDFEMGTCLQNVGVKAIDTRDNERYRFFHMPLQFILSSGLEGYVWYLKFVAFPPKKGFECCSETAVGFHYVKPGEMYIFHYLLYEFRSPYEFIFEESNTSRLSNSDSPPITKYKIGPAREVQALSNKVLCWDLVFSEVEKAPLKNTWEQRCNKLVLLSSVSESDDYQMAALEYLYEKYFNEADWFVKADVSTYVVVENLKLELRNYDPNSPVYFKIGSGYILSKEALRKFVMQGLTKECTTGNEKAEKLENCLKRVGVEIKDLNSRFLHIDLNKTFPITYHQEDLKPAIGFKNVNLNQLYLFDYLIYRLRPFPLSSKQNHLRFLAYALILLLIIYICKRVWLSKNSFIKDQ